MLGGSCIVSAIRGFDDRGAARQRSHPHPGAHRCATGVPGFADPNGISENDLRAERNMNLRMSHDGEAGRKAPSKGKGGGKKK